VLILIVLEVTKHLIADKTSHLINVILPLIFLIWK